MWNMQLYKKHEKWVNNIYNKMSKILFIYENKNISLMLTQKMNLNNSWQTTHINDIHHTKHIFIQFAKRIPSKS